MLYLVPINPIGEINRKGKDNNPKAMPGEPGSPYAIGSRLGGHDAVDPELGTLEDFRRFRKAVRDHGMELAIDFAIQCAPDHPWLKEHPNWFKRRADGSIRYAENPPKKYEDIVNVDFDQPDWQSLWNALRDAMLFWADEGVRIFRIDNPHTSPWLFWEWVIGAIKARFPDALFLAEAFTRPKMMKRLAKAGFNQSYSYFTWRNTKQELTEYLTELTQSESRNSSGRILRQHAGYPAASICRPAAGQASRIRQVLAATLGSTYGIYNGFGAVRGGGDPRPRGVPALGKIRVQGLGLGPSGPHQGRYPQAHRLRQASPALRLFTNLTFCRASGDSVIFYMKRTPDGADTVFVAVTVDPHTPVETGARISALDLGAAGSRDARHRRAVHRRAPRMDRAAASRPIDPAVNPALVLRVVPSGAHKHGKMMSEADPLWYKDAVIYQLHIKAFFDSNDDGIGDFRGLTQKLDYLQDLGVTALWLLSVLPLAAARRRLRHRRLQGRQPVLRHDGGFQGVRARGASVQFEGRDRAGRPTTPPTSTRGSSAPAAPRRAPRTATTTSGRTPTRNMSAPASSSSTARSRTGPGTASPSSITGTASTTISRI